MQTLLLCSSQHLHQLRLPQVAKATLSDASVLLDSLTGDDQLNGSSGDTFEGSTRERFQAAAAVSPRFLLLDFRLDPVNNPVSTPDLSMEFVKELRCPVHYCWAAWMSILGIWCVQPCFFVPKNAASVGHLTTWEFSEPAVSIA